MTSGATVSEKQIGGSCLCGAIRFQVTLPTIFCAHCHCGMCRRNHGASYVTWFAIERAQLEMTDGDAVLVRHSSSDHGTRSFCGTCGTSLFCESSHRPDEVDIVLASMDGEIDRPPQLHVYFDHGASWVAIGDDLPRLGGPTGVGPIEPDEPGTGETSDEAIG